MKGKKFMSMLGVLALTAAVAAVPVSAKEKEVSPVEKTVQVGTDTLHYYVLPEKASKKKEANQTFLVIHGAFMSHGATDDVAQALNKKYPHSKVVQLDLPSHGASTSTVGPKTSVEDLAETVGEAVDEMRDSGDIQGDLVPVGWSMGGSTALAMNLQGVDMKAIVLLNSAPEWSSLGFFAGLQGDQVIQAFQGAFAGDLAFGSTPEQAAKLTARLPELTAAPVTAEADVKALLSFDIRDQLQDIDVPVVVISGDKDVVATMDNQKLMTQEIPDTNLYIFPGDGHTLLMKQGKKVAQVISRYVKN